jgi:hypothetical protein
MLDILMPDDIKNLLREAAAALKDPVDQQLAERLIASLDATDILEWDRRLIATVLAKSGKIDECRKIIKGIPAGWERADAMRGAGESLVQTGDTENGISLLDNAVEEAKQAQEQGNESDQQCASAVLVDISEMYCLRGNFDSAEKIVDIILPGIRQQRALDRLRELRGDTIEEDAAD